MPRDPWAYRAPRYHTLPHWEDTYGPEVGALCTQVGLEPDPEQQEALDVLFGVTEAGTTAAYETGIIAPRQALKTGLGKMAVLGWMFITKEDVITWSAHQFSTTEETFRDIQSLIEGSPLLRRRMPSPKGREIIGGVRGRAGSEGFNTKAGSEVRFRARTREGARGLTGDKIVLDEAYALLPEHMGSMLPTLTVVPDPQILYLSSAGMFKSEVLRDLRDRGRAGAPRLAYLEWCAEHRMCKKQLPNGDWVDNPACRHPKPSDPSWKPGCALDDEELWAQAYPLLGRVRANGSSLTLEKLRDFRRSEPSSEWMRERMGWWDDPGASDLFGQGSWENCAGTIPDGTPLSGVGVAVSYDLQRTAIVGAAGTKKHPSVRVLAHDTGTDWVFGRLQELKARFPSAQVVLDEKGPSSTLFRDMKKLDRTATPQVRPTGLTMNQMMDACNDLYIAVLESRFTHENDQALNKAAESVVRRDVSDRWLWGRRGSTSDISPLEAATLATWTLAEDEKISAYASGRGVLTV